MGKLHISVGSECNNNCIFCMEADREQRRRREGVFTPEMIRRLLSDNQGAESVMFTSGEPTLCDNLPEYISMAAGAGFREIGLTTNGRRFSYPAFAEELLARGLNHVVVSIHGADARHHDAQTRVKGSYQQTLSGLENLSRLKKKYRLRLFTSTVINSRNWKRLGEIYLSLDHLSVDKFIFNFIQPQGRGESGFTRLVPRYGQVVRSVRSFLNENPAALQRMQLVDMPPCVLAGLPESVCGYVEPYTALDAPVPGEDTRSPVMENVRHGVSILDRDLFLSLEKFKRDECRGCRVSADCTGVWGRYIVNYGWDEFTPIPR